jgi:hypothetical protein
MTLGLPTLREALTAVRAAEVPLPDDAEARASAAVAAMPVGPPAWLDAVLFVAVGPVVGALLCGCFPIFTFAPAMVGFGLLLLVGASLARFIVHGQIGRVLAPPLLAVALVSRLLIGGGATQVFGDELATLAALIALEGLALVAYPDRAHRAISMVVLCALLITFTVALPQGGSSALGIPRGALEGAAGALRDGLLGGFLGLGVALVVARPLVAATAARHAAEPVSVGLLIAGLAGLGRFWTGWAEESWIFAVGATTGTLALAVVAICLYRASADAISWVAALFGAALLVGLGLGLPGLSAALAVVLLGLLARDAWIVGVGTIALVSFGSWAYWAIDLPVLAKTGALVGSGLVLLGLRALMRWRSPRAVPA